MSEHIFELVRLEPKCGGEPLCQVVLSSSMFAANAMQAEAVAFEEMKVGQDSLRKSWGCVVRRGQV